MRISVKSLRGFIRETLLEAEADVKPLLKINQRALRKRDPGYDPRKEPERAKTGPVFSSEVLEIISELTDQDLNRLPNRKGFIKWLANAMEDAISHADVGYTHGWRSYIRDIIDYVVSEDIDPSSLGRLTDVSNDAWYWHAVRDFSGAGEPRREETNVIHDFGDGFTLVELEQCDLGSEGAEMGHCVGSYSVDGGTRILSLRDAQNKSHVTIEVQDGTVQQIKGKQNRPPVEKYAAKIREWLPKSGLKYERSMDYIAILGPDDLRELSNSPDSDIRFIVAMSPQISQDVLARLASDEDVYVRQSVARNLNTSPNVLLQLSKNADSDVRIAVAMNPNTPKNALVRLSTDKNPGVRKRAKETLVKKERDR